MLGKRQLAKTIGSIAAFIAMPLIAYLFVVGTANYMNQKYLHNATLNSLCKTFDIGNRIYLSAGDIDETDFFSQAFNKKKRIDYIVVHHDANEIETDHVPLFEISQYHKSKGWTSISYHYYIARNGKIYKCHDEWLETFHCGALNSESIGVCMQGHFDVEYSTYQQLESLKNLLLKLKVEFDIVPAKIIRHSEVTNSKTSCPGLHTNLEAVKSQLNESHYFEVIINTVKRWIQKL